MEQSNIRSAQNTAQPRSVPSYVSCMAPNGSNSATIGASNTLRLFPEMIFPPTTTLRSNTIHPIHPLANAALTRLPNLVLNNWPLL